MTSYVAAEVHVQGSCKVDLNRLPTTGYLGGLLNSFTDTASTLLLNPFMFMSNSFNNSASTLLIPVAAEGHVRLSSYVAAEVHVRLTLYVAAEVHIQGSCKVDLNHLPTTGYLG